MNQSEIPKRPIRRMLIALVIVLVIVAAGLLYWFFVGRFYVSTSDAYVDGNKIAISPQVNGVVQAIYADNMDMVKKGQLLLELDKTDAQLRLEKRSAELAQAIRQTAELYDKKRELEAGIVAKLSQLEQARFNYERRKGLVEQGAISLEEFKRVKHQYEMARASFDAAKEAKLSVDAALSDTPFLEQPAILQAKSALKEAWVLLQRCSIVAPVDGLLAQRHAQLGQHVSEELAVFSLVPLDHMWITANFRELSLRKIQPGQSVAVTVDMYGDGLKFNGIVSGVGGGTGSVFSLLPPQNATGNWIKIVQRVPVRILLDPKEILAHPLRLGLSGEVKIDLHPESKKALPVLVPGRPLYHTDTLSAQLFGVENLIKSIEEANVPPKHRLQPTGEN